MSKQSMSTKILDLIGASDGMSFTMIQRHLFQMSKSLGNGPRRKKMSRGWWCTNLLGTGASCSNDAHPGLLHFFCTKGEDGLWRRNERSHENRPWTLMRNEHRPNGRGRGRLDITGASMIYIIGNEDEACGMGFDISGNAKRVAHTLRQIAGMLEANNKESIRIHFE